MLTRRSALLAAAAGASFAALPAAAQRHVAARGARARKTTPSPPARPRARRSARSIPPRNTALISITTAARHCSTRTPTCRCRRPR